MWQIYNFKNTFNNNIKIIEKVSLEENSLLKMEHKGA